MAGIDQQHDAQHPIENIVNLRKTIQASKTELADTGTKMQEEGRAFDAEIAGLKQSPVGALESETKPDVVQETESAIQVVKAELDALLQQYQASEQLHDQALLQLLSSLQGKAAQYARLIEQKQNLATIHFNAPNNRII